MQRLIERIGSEQPIDSQTRAIRDFVRECDVDVVGAMHVTCSEPCERECVESFQHHFAEDQLPTERYAAKSPFRTATLGGRYEWGSAALAENYFALGERDDSHLLLVKLNTHVAVSRDGSELVFGNDIADGAPPMCGALHEALSGEQTPATISLAEAFRSEGLDRIAMLNDPAVVNPPYRGLLAAVAAARLQARRVVLDLQNSRHTELRILVLPAVTINRSDRDTELFVGLYDAKFSKRGSDIRYRGLGDDPSQYMVTQRNGLTSIADAHLGQDREARDHRLLVAEQWRTRGSDLHWSEEQSPKIMALAQRAVVKPSVSQEVLKTFLRLLADAALVPTAIMLFVDGVAGIHNIYRAYRLSTGQGSRDDAEEILQDAMARLGTLDEHQARQVVLQLCQGLNIPTSGTDQIDVAAATVEKFEETEEATATPMALPTSVGEQPASIAEPVIDTVAQPLASSTSKSNVAKRDRAAAAGDGVDDLLTTTTAPSMELDLDLDAGSSLQMSSLPETSLTLGEETLGEFGQSQKLELGGVSLAKQQRPSVNLGSDRSADTTIQAEAKPIIDETSNVADVDVPQIEAATPSIVDTAKEVTELASPDIDVVSEEIVDQAKQVPVAAQAIVAEAAPIPTEAPSPKAQSTVSPQMRFFEETLEKSAATSPLRQPHVVQPASQRSSPTPKSTPADDVIVEAELIAIDDDDDAIIIIDQDV